MSQSAKLPLTPDEAHAQAVARGRLGGLAKSANRARKQYLVERLQQQRSSAEPVVDDQVLDALLDTVAELIASAWRAKQATA